MNRRTLISLSLGCLLIAALAMIAWSFQAGRDATGAAATAGLVQVVFAVGVLLGVFLLALAGWQWLRDQIAQRTPPPAPAPAVVALPPPDALRLATHADGLIEQAHQARDAGRPEQAAELAEQAVVIRAVLAEAHAALFAADLDEAERLHAALVAALPPDPDAHPGTAPG